MKPTKQEPLFSITNAPRDAQRRVWLNWLGLHLAGYELWQTIPALVPMIQGIKGTLGTEGLVAYFLQARTGLSEVNPWWPGASALSAAAYFCAEDLAGIDMEAYLASEAAIISHGSWRDTEFLAWVEALPRRLAELGAIPAVRAALSAVEVYLELHADALQAALRAEQSLIAGFLGGKPSGLDLRLLQNPLQAWQLMDQVHEPGALTVIATQIRRGSLLHEVLHFCLEPHREQIASQIRAGSPETRLDLGLLKEQGYSWEGEAVPGARAFEEGLVRALSQMALHGGKPEVDESLDALARSGFSFVRNLIPLRQEDLSVDKLPEILQAALG